MKKHIVWLLLVMLVFSTAVAVAAHEPALNTGTIAAIGSQAPAQGTGGCTIGSWTTVASLNTARSRPSAAFFPGNGNFYALGGETTGGNRDIPIEEYDVGADTWTDRANLLTGVSNTGSAAVGSYIYVPGGYTGAAVDTMQRYDPVANSVTTMAAMPGSNFAHAVTAVGTEIFVMGGNSAGTAGTTNFIYDTVADSWSTGAPIPVATRYAGVTTDGTYVYVLGGDTTDLTNVQRYDPVADSWMAMTPMNTGRGGPGAFFDGQNIWAIAGGWSSYLTSTEYWDGSSWTNGPTVNTGVRTVGAAFGDGLGLKAGGWNAAFSAAAETIDIDCGGPGIVIEKSPAYQDVLINGTADFTITVTNTSAADLDNVTVSDALVPDCDNSLGTLAAGASSSYTCSDIGVTASYTNTAVVTSTAPQGPGPSASDDAIVMVWDASLEIEKAPDLQIVDAGGTANFTITVTNTGSNDLISVTVSDAMVPACDAAIGPLSAGASNTYTCSDVGVTMEYTNTAVVTGSIDAGLPVPAAMDDAYVALPPTAVSLTNFGSDSAALTPIWLAALLGLVLGFGILLRRRLVD